MIRGWLLAFALALCGCATAPSTHPEARVFDPASDGAQAFDAARARSETSGRPLIAVLGANWCHDSRALAGWLETPRFRQLVADHFELVFVDVGHPQTGDGRNLQIAERFGIAKLASTPAVLVIAADGTLLNRDSAIAWRNAAIRSEDAIFGELSRYAAHSPVR